MRLNDHQVLLQTTASARFIASVVALITESKVEADEIGEEFLRQMNAYWMDIISRMKLLEPDLHNPRLWQEYQKAVCRWVLEVLG